MQTSCAGGSTRFYCDSHGGGTSVAGHIITPQESAKAILILVSHLSSALLLSQRSQSGPEGKGGFVGFGGVRKRAHIYRAILEGLAYELRSGKGALAPFNS